jgi:hypothetical protein
MINEFEKFFLEPPIFSGIFKIDIDGIVAFGPIADNLIHSGTRWNSLAIDLAS